MDIHMQSHHWAHRSPDWTAALVAGFFAGAMVMVLELLWSVAVGVSPWTVCYQVAAMTMGPDILPGTAFDLPVVAVALITHYVLGIVFGAILAAIIAPFNLDSSVGMVLSVGALFGLLLYAINFYVMVRAFPWMADMRGWGNAFAHLAFGMTAAIAYWKLERPQSEKL